VIWEHELPEGGAAAVAFSPDGKHIAASLREPHNEIRVWNAETQKLLAQIKNVPGISWQRSLAFTPDGNRLGCGFADTTVLIWNWKQHQSEGNGQ
jgi:WD40 repeat protein